MINFLTLPYTLQDLQLGEHFQCAAPNATAVTKPKTPSLGETVIRLYRYIRRKYDNRAGLSFLSALYRYLDPNPNASCNPAQQLSDLVPKKLF